MSDFPPPDDPGGTTPPPPPPPPAGGGWQPTSGSSLPPPPGGGWQPGGGGGYSDPQGYQGYGGPPQVPNYLVQSILVTLFCCLPIGIAAIVFATQANSKAAAGDYQGALTSAASAKQWCWIAFGAGIAIFFLYFVFGAALVGV